MYKCTIHHIYALLYYIYTRTHSRIYKSIDKLNSIKMALDQSGINAYAMYKHASQQPYANTVQTYSRRPNIIMSDPHVQQQVSQTVLQLVIQKLVAASAKLDSRARIPPGAERFNAIGNQTMDTLRNDMKQVCTPVDMNTINSRASLRDFMSRQYNKWDAHQHPDIEDIRAIGRDIRLQLEANQKQQKVADKSNAIPAQTMSDSLDPDAAAVVQSQNAPDITNPTADVIRNTHIINPNITIKDSSVFVNSDTVSSMLADQMAQGLADTQGQNITLPEAKEDLRNLADTMGKLKQILASSATQQASRRTAGKPGVLTTEEDDGDSSSEEDDDPDTGMTFVDGTDSNGTGCRVIVPAQTTDDPVDVDDIPDAQNAPITMDPDRDITSDDEWRDTTPTLDDDDQ